MVVHIFGVALVSDYDQEILGPSPAQSVSPAGPPDPIVEVAEIAGALRVHYRTVQRWLLAGKLRGHRKGNIRSRWRVRLSDIDRAYWAASAPHRKRMLEAMIRAGLRSMQADHGAH